MSRQSHWYQDHHGNVHSGSPAGTTGHWASGYEFLRKSADGQERFFEVVGLSKGGAVLARVSDEQALDYGQVYTWQNTEPAAPYIHGSTLLQKSVGGRVYWTVDGITGEKVTGIPQGVTLFSEDVAQGKAPLYKSVWRQDNTIGRESVLHVGMIEQRGMAPAPVFVRSVETDPDHGQLLVMHGATLEPLRVTQPGL